MIFCAANFAVFMTKLFFKNNEKVNSRTQGRSKIKKKLRMPFKHEKYLRNIQIKSNQIKSNQLYFRQTEKKLLRQL